MVQLDFNCGGTADVVGREEFSYASSIPKSPKKMVASWEFFKSNIPKERKEWGYPRTIDVFEIQPKGFFQKRNSHETGDLSDLA